MIAPVDVFIVKPLGRDGEIEYAIGDDPPLAVTGIRFGVTAPAVKVSAAIASVVESTDSTVNEKLFVAVADAASATVTVYVVAELVAVGVPVIAPVELLIDSPEGSEGETENEYGEDPYEPVTGVKEVAAAETARDFVAMIWFAVSGPVVTERALVLVPMEFTALIEIVTGELVAAPGTVIGEDAVPADV